ncbi:hypothetical protein C7M84_007008 [Penaeus vannamei]|uniref:H/ACA ribonucleoprotein complex non-core subunit NAF1 n=1 Tax=Penaeus vannamei TaxID=6689 RepID=A0A3R7PR68_PENVA|nr:hypothetical protein C7M84_007008 [Penaeus vannamei]
MFFRPKVVKQNNQKRGVLCTQGELLLEDLPPIEDLYISVPEEQAHPIGTVFSIVEQQVVVQGFPNIPPIDLDSVLFLEKGQRALGQVFDVFGPVQEPLYVVRFNSSEHIKEFKVNKGDHVYFAPTTEHTSFVVVDELMRMKGSDASGMQNNEPLPSEHVDFSDDEEEARVIRESRQNKYTSGTGEFQSQKKRSRGQNAAKDSMEGMGHGPKPGQGRGESRSNGRGPNPFSDMRMPMRPSNRFCYPHPMQPRFGPRGPPQFPMRPPGPVLGPSGFAGPPDMGMGMHNNMHGPPGMPVEPFLYDPNTHTQMDMSAGPVMDAEGFSGGLPPPPAATSWPQPPQFQFGGPPQFDGPRGPGCYPPPPPPPPGVTGPSGYHIPPGHFQSMGPSRPMKPPFQHPPASGGPTMENGDGMGGWGPPSGVPRHPPPPPHIASQLPPAQIPFDNSQVPPPPMHPPPPRNANPPWKKF